MKRVIVESPFKGEGGTVEAHRIVRMYILYARRCLSDCFKRNEAPFASHLLYTQPLVLRDEIPEERKLGIQAGLIWGKCAELTAVYVDYGISDGMKEGIQRAVEEGRPFEYREIGKNMSFHHGFLFELKEDSL